MSPQVDNSDAFQEPRPTEEERRLASSDLSDCEEVWIGELSDYIMETHKRQRQVESWFDASVLVSSISAIIQETAANLS